MAVTYAQRPFTAYTDAVVRIHREFGNEIDRTCPGKLVHPRVQSIRMFKGSRLVARAMLDLDTAEYTVHRVRPNHTQESA